jgi:hypothetical protein
MPKSNFSANKGLSYPLVENADDDGQPVADASVAYSSSDSLIVRVNDPGFVTPGGTTIATHSFSALANGSAVLTAKGTDAAGDEVDAELDITVQTTEQGTIVPGAGVP